jgi:hypothetical protein
MFLAETSVPSVVFIFCAPGVVSIGTGNVGSRLNVLRSRTHFQRYRVRQVPYSCFARPDSFSTVPRASISVFIFCAPRFVFYGTEGVKSHFHVLRAWTRFPWHRGRRVPFSSFALGDSFSAVPRASAPVFMFCTPGLVFDGTEGVGSCFHVFRARTHFRRYRGCRDPFSSIGGARTCFLRYRRCRVPF